MFITKKGGKQEAGAAGGSRGEIGEELKFLRVNIGVGVSLNDGVHPFFGQKKEDFWEELVTALRVAEERRPLLPSNPPLFFEFWRGRGRGRGREECDLG